MTESKARAKVYRNAARLIERGETHTRGIGVRACFAIDQAAGFDWNAGGIYHEPGESLRRAYVDAILSGNSCTCALYPDYEDAKEANDERIVGLCFMAAMVEAGDA